MADKNDLPPIAQDLEEKMQGLWDLVKDTDNSPLKSAVTGLHHAMSDGLDTLAEVLDEERSFFLPVARSGPDDKPPR